MSDSASRLPARPSLEQLRKQAKDLLKDVRAGDAAATERVRLILNREPDTPTLSDAQFVVAREYGFDHWPALARHVDSVNPPGLGRFDALASELAAAYTSASIERIREINWTHGTSFYWYREADEMHRQLPTWYASSSRTADEALADARHLVARMSGFDGWAALARSLSTVTASPAVHPSSPAAAPFYHVDRERNTIGVRGLLSDTHWDTVAAVIEEQQLTGVWAPGSSDAALDRLTRLPYLRRLYLGPGMSDDGLRRLARLPGLEELSLGGPRSGISDRGLEVLRDLKQLRRFWMMWAPGVSDAGIANLAGCDRLEIVDLMGTPTGNGAIAALAHKPFLHKVATGRLVTDAGTALLPQFPQFATWQGGQIQYSLGSFDSEPTHLLLDGPFTNTGLARVAELDGLFGLNLFWHTTGFSGAGLTPLARLSRLGMLGCGGERCDDAVMRAAGGIPNLRMLMVQDTVATDEGFVALSRSQTIEHIWGGNTPNLTGRGFAALASMPALRGLAIGFHNLDDASLAMLPRFPALRTLMANGLADEGFRHVGRCAELEALTLSRNATDVATAHIAGLSKLKTFHAGETKITDRSLATLATMTSLEHVDVHGCAEITDAGVMLLAALPHLSQVSVGRCRQVTPAAATAFAPHVRVKYSE
jgi:hypothetical protein